jgi:protein-S-isoprenylcysteine O-methyltransferase Ste14
MVFNYYFLMMGLFIYVAGWAVATLSRWTKTGGPKAMSTRSRFLTIVGGFGSLIIGIQGKNLAIPLIHLPPPPLMTVLGCLLLTGGAGLSLWGCFQYHQVFSISERTRGGAFHPALPYTIIRQPFYAGLIMALPGFFCLVPSLYILVLTLFLEVIFILKARADDAFLTDRLGRSYAVYCDRVPLFLPSPLFRRN